jgi:mono/diheme cytochrome c family protein
MLVSRVAARGPYGWHGEAITLEQRIMFGFERHGWGGRWLDLGRAVPRANALAAFLRQGLVAPPRQDRELTDEEQRGHEVFMSSETRCATCHFPATDYTDRSVVKLGKQAPAESALFATEPNRIQFKTPSLLFVGRTAPYFHDGSASTLEELVEQNHDRMGRTNDLSPEDRRALVAYLKTIGIISGEPGSVVAAAPLVQPAAAAPVSFVATPVAEAIQNPLKDTSSLAIDPPLPEPSAQPVKAEWETAALVELPHQPDTCRIQRVREWVRIRCKLRAEDQPLAQVTFISGQREGVELSEKNGEGEVVLPVRRGDRRLFELDALVFAWKSAVVYGAAIVISEAWLPGEAAPALAVTYEARSAKSTRKSADVL